MHSFVEYDENTKIWKSTKGPYDEICGQSIGEIFLKRMRLRDFQNTKIVETYHDIAVAKSEADIYRESVTVAINLTELGIKKGDVIQLFSKNNEAITPLTMGGYMIGAAVNTFETKNEEARDIAYILQLLEPTLIVYESVFKPLIMAALQLIKLPMLQHFVCIDNQNTAPEHKYIKTSLLKKVSSLEIECFNCPKLEDPAEHVAVLLLTSGSTGKPKAVALNHTRILAAMLEWWEDQRSPELKPHAESVMLFLSNMRWISQTISVLLTTLLGIPRICFNKWPPIGSYFRDIVLQHRVTHIFGMPEYYKEMLQSVEPTDKITLASLQLVMLGGEKTPDTTIELSNQRAVNCKVWRTFGMTELPSAIVKDKNVNGGLLVSGVEMKIIDDDGNTLGPMQRGQLCLRVPAPFHYLKLDKSKTFLPDGFFNTGDYGFVDENCLLTVLTRYCNLVKTKDLVIVPNEFESKVNEIDGVLTSSLVAYRLDGASNAYDLAALFIVLKQLEPVASRNQIRANIEKTVYSKLCSKIRIENIYFMEALPKLAGGKIDQLALRKIAKEGALGKQ